jgi:hypothetical protein
MAYVVYHVTMVTNLWVNIQAGHGLCLYTFKKRVPLLNTTPNAVEMCSSTPNIAKRSVTGSAVRLVLLRLVSAYHLPHLPGPSLECQTLSPINHLLR